MSIQDLLSKIILRTVTQDDFYAYSENVDDLIMILTYDEEVEEILESFGFHAERRNSSMLIESGNYVINIVHARRTKYTVEIKYPV